MKRALAVLILVLCANAARADALTDIDAAISARGLPCSATRQGLLQEIRHEARAPRRGAAEHERARHPEFETLQPVGRL